MADAIRLLHDRYAPDAQSREAERHIRCTGEEALPGLGVWVDAG